MVNDDFTRRLLRAISVIKQYVMTTRTDNPQQRVYRVYPSVLRFVLIQLVQVDGGYYMYHGDNKNNNNDDNDFEGGHVLTSMTTINRSNFLLAENVSVYSVRRLVYTIATNKRPKNSLRFP